VSVLGVGQYHAVQQVEVRTIVQQRAGFTDVLTRAFGVPAVLADGLRDVTGIDEAYVYGSWAARHSGEPGCRPVGDIDVLVLGEPDRDRLYEAVSVAERRLGRQIQATVRESGWLDAGSGSFHETVTSRPMLKLRLALIDCTAPAAWLTAEPALRLAPPSPSRSPIRRPPW
jgi:hypothetical protein